MEPKQTAVTKPRSIEAALWGAILILNAVIGMGEVFLGTNSDMAFIKVLLYAILFRMLLKEPEF